MRGSPRTWVTDFRHSMEALEAADCPPQALRIARFHADVVEGLTAGWDDRFLPCPLGVQCIGRDGRRRCTERLIAVADSDEQIRWYCVRCGENGYIHHWHGTPHDLTLAAVDQFPHLDVMQRLSLNYAEYDTIASLERLDEAEQRLVAAGRAVDEDLVWIDAPRRWLEHFQAVLRAEASLTHGRVKKPRLQAVAARPLT